MFIWNFFCFSLCYLGGIVILSRRRYLIIPTKTIRFNEKDEKILYDNWNIEIVREFKAFLKEKLSLEQKLEAYILNSDNPKETKQDLIKEKLKLIKFMMRKGASQETLDRLSQEYFQLRKIHDSY